MEAAQRLANNINRVNTHVVAEFGSRKVTEFRRDELQTFLDGKARRAFV